jgi:hypothetical protein
MCTLTVANRLHLYIYVSLLRSVLLSTANVFVKCDPSYSHIIYVSFGGMPVLASDTSTDVLPLPRLGDPPLLVAIDLAQQSAITDGNSTKFVNLCMFVDNKNSICGFGKNLKHTFAITLSIFLRSVTVVCLGVSHVLFDLVI